MGILTLIVLIIIAVVFQQYEAIEGVTMFTAGQAGSIAASAAVGAVMEAASLLVSASIDPGISSMWNRMQNANLTMTGQVMERGVQTALQAAVTDQGKLPDLYDLDGDGVFGYAPGANPKIDLPKDTISRFSLYNTKRYLDLSAPDTTHISNFLAALHNFVVAPGDGWALLDPVYYPDNTTHAANASAGHSCFYPLGDPHRPAECDYCCDNFDPTVDAEGKTPGIPEECTATIRESCVSRSPFRDSGNEYPFIYDLSYEDSTNSFMSFREQLGRDDEHHLYHANMSNSNWHSAPVAGKETLSAADTGFYLKDTVGFYVNPPFSLATQDIWTSSLPPSPKLFPFLYKMKNTEGDGWGPNLKALSYANYECHWCDARSGYGCPADMASYPEISRLALTKDITTLPYNKDVKNWCVNKDNKGGVDDPPVVSDLVGGLSPELYVDKNVCAIKPDISPISELTKYHGGWKPGADRYCSRSVGALYSLDCPKHGIAAAPSGLPNPQCGETVDIFDSNGVKTGTLDAGPANLWPDDILDEMIYDMPELLDFERSLHRTASGPGGINKLVTTFEDWYGVPSAGETMTGGIADWIEPPCPDPSSCMGSFTKLQRPGLLWIWREELQWLNQQIQNWLVPSGRAYGSPATFGPTAAWCVPSLGAGNGSAPPKEIETFDANKNGIQGDVADVMACLNWNANDVRTYASIALPNPDHTAVGNAQKFQRCHDYCSADTCTDLPRSLMPDFYNASKFNSHKAANFFDAGNAADQILFNACLASGTINACASNCNNSVLPSGSPYNLPSFVAPNNPKIANIDPFCTANPTFNGTGLCNPPSRILNCADAASKATCKCSWAGSCAGADGGCSLDNTYTNAVSDALTVAKGSCFDTNYKQVIADSAKEAQVQVEKFTKRLKFLNGRYAEAMALSNDHANPLLDAASPDGILTVAIDKFTKFLDNGTPVDAAHPPDAPAEDLIHARQNYTASTSGDLPAFGIYVWQDADPFKTNPAGNLRWGDTTGYWHAVKAEARIPRRCAGNCIATEWPKIFSKTKKAGFLKKGKICYTLINLDGETKARVIRYDQDKDLRGLLFPGGAKIWEARLSHPQSGTPDPAGIRATCKDLIDPDLLGWLNDPSDVRSHLGAAFMLNRIPRFGDPTDANYENCWKVVHENLLSHGIQSEACAQYYFAGDGFRVKFVPCDRW